MAFLGAQARGCGYENVDEAAADDVLARRSGGP